MNTVRMHLLLQCCSVCLHSFVNKHHHHRFLNREGRWGTTDDFATSFFPSIFPCSRLPSGTCRTPGLFIHYVVFPPLSLPALFSSPFHCALQDGFGQTWWTGDMTIPLRFASLYDSQEVFVWTNCLLDLGTDCLVGNMVFVWNVLYLAVAPHFHGLYFSLQLCCEGPWFTIT